MSALLQILAAALFHFLAVAVPSPTVLDVDSEVTHEALTLAPAPVEDVPEMEYTYIEANYLWTDSDTLDETVDGVEVTGSLELPLNLFAQLTASRQSGDVDLDQYRLGIGYHLSIGSRIDAYGILSAAHAETDGSDDDFDDDGIAGEVGVRMLLTPRIEVNGSAEWADVDESDYGVGVGGRFYLIDMLSLGARAEFLDSGDSYTVGVRFEL
jgi:hypothetical protein